MSKRKLELPKGVSYDKTHRGAKKHKARIFWNGKDRFLGRFETAQEAGTAYQQALTLLKSSGTNAATDPVLLQRVQAMVQQTAVEAPAAAAGSQHDEQQVASSHQTACGSGSTPAPQQPQPDEITSSLRGAQTPQLSQSFMQVLDSWLDGGCQLASLCPPAALPQQLVMQQQQMEAAAASLAMSAMQPQPLQQLAASGSAATAASVDASQGQLEELLTSMLLQHGIAPQLPPQQPQQQPQQAQHLAHLESLLEQQLQARLRAGSADGAARASASPSPRVATPSTELGVQRQQLQLQPPMLQQLQLQPPMLQQLLMFQQQLQPQKSIDPLRLLLEEQLQHAGQQANIEVRRSASASPVVAEATQHGGSSSSPDSAAGAACQPAAGSGNTAARTTPDARAASPPAAAAATAAAAAATTAAAAAAPTAAATTAAPAPAGGGSDGSLAGLERCDAVQMVSELSRAFMQLHLALCCKCDDDAAADMMLWLFSVRQHGLAAGASAASPQLQRAVLHVLSQVVGTLSMTAAPGGQGGTPQRQFVLAVLEKLSGVTLQLLQALRQHQGSSEQEAQAAATLKQQWLERLQAEATSAAEDAAVVRLAALL